MSNRTKVALALILLGLLAIPALLDHQLHHQIRKAQKQNFRNVYVITASGLRADHLTSYLYQHGQTPAIDFLAYDGVLFLNGFSTSPESLSAHLSLLTGLYPFQRPIRRSLDLLQTGAVGDVPDLKSLPQLFRQKGYRTAAILSDPELRFPSFFQRLFAEVFCGDVSLHSWQQSYAIGAACSLAQNWILEHRRQRQFLFVNFGEPTLPFQPPAPYNRHYARHPYDGEVAALDEQIGHLIHMLKYTGLFEESIVVFTSPYGESLEGEIRTGNLSESVLHVPLLVSAPGLLPRHKEYTHPVSLVDVLPTILTLMEWSPDMKPDGLPLFEKGTDGEISRAFVFGETRTPHFFGMPSRYFIKTEHTMYVTGKKESLEPSRLRKALEEELKKANISLLSSQNNLLEFDPGALLENAVLLARQGQPDRALDLLNSFGQAVPETPYLKPLKAELFRAVVEQKLSQKDTRAERVGNR